MNYVDTFAKRYRHSIILLKQLVITDFKLRYQGSVLGYLWSLFRPMLLFCILLTVFGFILKIGSDMPNYPLYLLIGIVLWSFFLEATSNGLQSIVVRGDLIRKISFPKYIIVVAASISALINLGISLAVVFAFMLITGVELRPIALLAPILILELYIFALALSFFLSALYVRYRDVSYIWELIMQAAFYATPILYPLALVFDKSEFMAKIMLLNPVAQIIQDTRYVLVTTETNTMLGLTHSWYTVAIPPVIVALTAILASRYFRRQSKYFAENV